MPTIPTVATTLDGKGTGTSGATVDSAMAYKKPDDGFAALTRAQYQYYLDKGRPQEVAALKEIRDPKLGLKMAARAEKGVNKTFSDLKGIERRAASQFGVKLKADESRVVQRRVGLDKALATVSSRNTAMYGTEDMQLQTGGDALNIGQGLAGQAAQGLGSAASSAYAVRNANRQAGANRTSGALSSAASMGAAGYMLASAQAGGMSGPVGAAVGAGVGLIMSFI
jgi:hypothetical protein